MAVKAGDVVAERFEIGRLAGRGGMGSVWRARDRVEGSDVALKVLHVDRGEDRDEDTFARFAREAALLAELRHPGIVRYVTHGVTEDGEAFLAMEWIEGETLRQRLGRGPLEPFEVVGLGRRLGEALGVVHRRGVIHRDVKPMNILLPGGAPERAKLLDFGIARIGASADVTETGVLVGTWAYMSPEMAMGRRDLDARSDVFQLGAVLYECLTGVAPFRAAAGTAMLAKICLEDPPPVRELRPDVPPVVASFVERAILKSPIERFADGADMAAEASAVIEATDASRPIRPSRFPRAIGKAEQRVVCVVLARRRSDDEPTMVTRDPTKVDVREEPLAAAAAAHGGTLHVLANGSALITLGAAPGSTSASAPTDEAARAAACALGLRHGAPDLCIALGTGLGLTTAAVPVGDAIDRAASLLGGVTPGTIAVDPVTAGLLEARFELHPSAEAPGFLLGRERDAGATRTLLGKPTRCVGRDRELAMLDALYEECATEPIARVAVITGPAGVGKSRVRYELQRRIAARGTDVETLIARGDPTTARSPFGLAADALRRAAGILEGEPRATRQEKLRARLARAIDDPALLERTLVFLAEMIRAPFPESVHPVLRAARVDAVAMGDAIRTAWDDWLTAECGLHPVVLVLEDLHWGDLPTVRLVDASLRNLRDCALFVIALARPEVQEIFPGLWQERDVQSLALAPLTRSAAEKLVREVLGQDTDAATVALLVQRAEGNAFYLEELIRAVAEGSGETLPDTVVGMVQSRLSGLGAEARRVLRAASVFGTTFWTGGVMRLLGGERERALCEEQLAHLCAIELVTRRPDSTFPDEVEHVFRHALVREGAYAMLTEDDRRIGHALAGDWLDKSGSTHALALAEHFDRGAQPGRAAGWWARAAEEALAANDYLDAVARAQHAIACDPSGERRGRMMAVQTEAHRCRGAALEALAAGEDALAAFEPGSATWLHVLGEMIAASASLGAYDRILDLVTEMRRHPSPDEPKARVATAVTLCRAASHLWQAGHGEISIEMMDEAEAMIAQDAEPAPVAMGWLCVARAQKALHRDDKLANMTLEEEALHWFDRAGYARLAATRRMNLGHILAELGELNRSEVYLRQALAGGERLGLPVIVGYALQNLGKLYFRRGQLPEARDRASRSVDYGVKLTSPRLEGTSRAYLAEILLACGDVRDAEREARAAVSLLTHAPSLHVYASAVLAGTLIAQGRFDEAEPLATFAKDRLDEHGIIEEGEAVIRRVYEELKAKRPASG